MNYIYIGIYVSRILLQSSEKLTAVYRHTFSVRIRMIYTLKKTCVLWQTQDLLFSMHSAIKKCLMILYKYCCFRYIFDNKYISKYMFIEFRMSKAFNCFVFVFYLISNHHEHDSGAI